MCLKRVERIVDLLFFKERKGNSNLFAVRKQTAEKAQSKPKSKRRTPKWGKARMKCVCMCTTCPEEWLER